MSTAGYLGSVGSPPWLANEVDLWFLADIAKGMQWAARFDVTLEAGAHTRMVHEHIAGGTVDAFLWVLGPVLVSPVTGRRGADRSRLGVTDELEAAVMRRTLLDSSHPDWYYLGGVADALEFALGFRSPFWWVPLPDGLRAGPPARDEYAFTV